MDQTAKKSISDFERPELGYALFVWPVTGILLGWWLTPANGSDAILALFVISGAVGGVLLLFGGVTFANRILKISVAFPVVLGSLGGIVGMLAGMALCRITGFAFSNNLVLLGPMIAMALAGTILGFVLQYLLRGAVHPLRIRDSDPISTAEEPSASSPRQKSTGT